MEIISNVALISINETLFAQLGSFLIFMFIMNRIMIQPLRGVIHERNEYIESLKRDVYNAEADMEEIQEQLKKQENTVRAEALSLKEQAEALGAKKADEIFAAVNKQIAELKAKTEREVSEQLTGARTHLKKESEMLAKSIIEKVLDRRINL